MTTWVLLRGLTRERGHWGAFVATFARAVEGARVLAVDLPGNGEHYRMASPCRVGDMAEFCRDTLAAQGFRPPYHLLAMSLGAMVAVAWASVRPHEIAGCVLINTSLRPLSPFYRRLRPANYPRLLRIGVLGADVCLRERAILAVTSRLRADDAALIDDWVNIARKRPVSRGNALRQLCAAARFRAPVEPPSVPTLVLAGAGDALVHPHCSRALAAAWQCPIGLHPRAGHDLPLDDGPWVAEQVRQWLANPATPPPRQRGRG